MLAVKADPELVSSALLRNMVGFKTLLHWNKAEVAEEEGGSEGGERGTSVGKG